MQAAEGGSAIDAGASISNFFNALTARQRDAARREAADVAKRVLGEPTFLYCDESPSLSQNVSLGPMAPVIAARDSSDQVDAGPRLATFMCCVQVLFVCDRGGGGGVLCTLMSLYFVQVNRCMIRPDVRSDAELQREKARRNVNSRSKTVATAADLFTTRLVVLPILRLENLLPYPVKVGSVFRPEFCVLTTTTSALCCASADSRVQPASEGISDGRLGCGSFGR